MVHRKYIQLEEIVPMPAEMHCIKEIAVSGHYAKLQPSTYRNRLAAGIFPQPFAAHLHTNLLSLILSVIVYILELHESTLLVPAHLLEYCLSPF